MTAKEALHLYKSRDVSEKFFASDKSFLGNKSMRSHTNEGVEGRIFTQFIALIIRNTIYTALQEENEKLEKCKSRRSSLNDRLLHQEVCYLLS